MEQSHPIICGGLSDTRDAGKVEQDLADKVRHSLEENEGKTFTMYHATKYRVQVVNGFIYYIKIDVGEPQNFIHAQIYECPTPDHEVSLVKYEKYHTDSDEINP